MSLSENLSVGKFDRRKMWLSENVVVGKFAVGKYVSENLASEKLCRKIYRRKIYCRKNLRIPSKCPIVRVVQEKLSTRPVDHPGISIE